MSASAELSLNSLRKTDQKRYPFGESASNISYAKIAREFMKSCKIAKPALFAILPILLFFARVNATSTGLVFFDGYWKSSALVLSGSIELIGAEPTGVLQLQKYRMRINKIYKGTSTNSEIVFYSYGAWFEPDRTYNPSKKAIQVEPGKEYLLFIHSDASSPNLMGTAIVEATQDNRSELEHAVQYCRELDRAIDPVKLKEVLLNEAKQYNSFTSYSCDVEIVRKRYSEAIPIFMERLKQPNVFDRSIMLTFVVDLGVDRKSLVPQVMEWLSDSKWNGPYTLILFKRLGPEYAPVVRKFIDSKDELLAAWTRAALLDYGERDAKKLLFDLAQHSGNLAARCIAIGAFSFSYKGSFTTDEIEMLKRLSSEKDKMLSDTAKTLLNRINKLPPSTSMAQSEIISEEERLVCLGSYLNGKYSEENAFQIDLWKAGSKVVGLYTRHVKGQQISQLSDLLIGEYDEVEHKITLEARISSASGDLILVDFKGKIEPDRLVGTFKDYESVRDVALMKSTSDEFNTKTSQAHISNYGELVIWRAEKMNRVIANDLTYFAEKERCEKGDAWGCIALGNKWRSLAQDYIARILWKRACGLGSKEGCKLIGKDLSKN